MPISSASSESASFHQGRKDKNLPTHSENTGERETVLSSEGALIIRVTRNSGPLTVSARCADRF